MSTIRSVAVLLLRDAGITTLAPAQDADNTNVRGVPEGMLDAVAQAINGAYAELYARSPSSMFERRASAVLRPKTTITADVTQYSTDITINGGESWMRGCTVLLGGDGYDNEITQSLGQLLRPYMGPTGNVIGSVWGDAIMLPANECNVLDPVNIRGLRTLAAATWEQFGTTSGTLRTLDGSPMYVSNVANKQSGQPCLYMADTRYDQTTNTPTRANFLRVTPMPDQAYPIDYRVLATPPVVTADSIDLGDHEAEVAVDAVVPWPELTLYAVARMHFTSDPLFTNREALPEIARQWKLAIDSLPNATPQATGPAARYEDGTTFRKRGFSFRR